MKALKFYNKEFEMVVRHELLLYDREITEDDVLKVLDLDCSEFTFNMDDCETISFFKNLDWLSINVNFEDLSFLRNFKYLEELSIEFYRDTFDATHLLPLSNLRTLFVSGGVISNFKFKNTYAFTKLPNLISLSLHEFGEIDLLFLKDMPCLESFACLYANKANNVETVSLVSTLKYLDLCDIKLECLSFLDGLKDELKLYLTAVVVEKEYDVEKLKRFRAVDLIESTINEKWYNWETYENPKFDNYDD